MEPGIDIRRRTDGSIDIDHYARIARAERAATVRQSAWTIAGAARSAFRSLVAKRSDTRRILRVAR